MIFVLLYYKRNKNNLNGRVLTLKFKLFFYLEIFLIALEICRAVWYNKVYKQIERV